MKLEIADSDKFRKLLAVVSFGCFLGSFIVHFSAVFEITLIRSEWVFFLIHFGMFIPLILMTLCFQKEHKIYKLNDNEDYWNRFFQPMPTWTRYFVYFVFGYVILNFFLMIPSSSQVKTAIVNEKYVLVPIKSGNPAQNILREISKSEFEQQNSYETRLISGHWLLFYLIPALFFWFERGKQNSPSLKN